MFFFGKKKTAEKNAAETKQEVNIEELLGNIENLKQSLTNAADKAERIKILNEIGSSYFKANEIDQAIHYYEQSLEEDRQLGKAYTDLLKLYNMKRQEAAEAKDDEKLELYMNKVQGLMQQSKDIIRGKI